ncbi:metallophosphoesterase family protein [Fusibacter ferrireducens]|uniref:Metallophosphoesterase family protein n=1 Tax=Fusibacter ferrireducens TaxID=2785058 RepID=A0ABR9ZYH3_9FIRM|nr:metallophosphoesterase family protein [Fusibacter ferrireducens]MBF4695516.1 metallophosphoesterase family protein [Fusibacter ferrireducens]
MKKIAVISDIHGNVFALDAVLGDIQSRNIDIVVNLGDVLIGPIDPVSTAKRLMDMKDIINIMGNGDELLLQDKITSSSYDFTKPLLTPEMLEWLGEFKREWVYENILFCHASPQSNHQYLLEEVTSKGIVSKSIEKLQFELRDIIQDYIVCGHSHMCKTVYVSDNKVVINAGSVGLPAYTDEEPLPHFIETLSPFAKYVIITTQNKIINKIEYVEVNYDWNKASEIAKNNSRDDYAYPIKTGLALKEKNRS